MAHVTECGRRGLSYVKVLSTRYVALSLHQTHVSNILTLDKVMNRLDITLTI